MLASPLRRVSEALIRTSPVVDIRLSGLDACAASVPQDRDAGSRWTENSAAVSQRTIESLNPARGSGSAIGVQHVGQAGGGVVAEAGRRLAAQPAHCCARPWLAAFLEPRLGTRDCPVDQRHADILPRPQGRCQGAYRSQRFYHLRNNPAARAPTLPVEGSARGTLPQRARQPLHFPTLRLRASSSAPGDAGARSTLCRTNRPPSRAARQAGSSLAG